MSIWLIMVAITFCRFLGIAENAISDIDPRTQNANEQTTIWLPATLVKSQIDQSVSEQEVVECEIFGTKIIGVSRCKGTLVSNVEAGQGRAEIRCVLKGVIESENVGTNGPAKINSTTSTSFTAVKILKFDGLQLASTPVELNVETTLAITGVETHLAGAKGVLVKRVAASRTQATKEEVRAASEEMTKRKLGNKIDKAFEKQLSRVNLVLKVCRHALATFGNRELLILTRFSDQSNVEFGLGLMASNLSGR